jgi:hypothetical protein
MENHLALFRAMDQESLATISMVDCDPGVQEKCFFVWGQNAGRYCPEKATQGKGKFLIFFYLLCLK